MELETNIIYCGDCLGKLKDIPNESIDLIYIDPPFSSNRNYAAFWQEQEERHFEDRFENVGVYLGYMEPRLKELYRVLKPTGSFYYHCDWHASHYIKMLLDSGDRLFGYSNFRNEIVWKRRYGTFSTVHESNKFGSCTDSLFFYAKTEDAPFYPQYSFKDANYQEYVKKTFRYVDENGRCYRVDNLANPAPRPNLMYEYKGYKPPKNGWAISREKMEQWDKEGRLYFPEKLDGRIQRKRFLDELKGKPVQNLWDDIEMVSSQSDERLGYPTQKPEALLERIIRASSNEGDIVLDAFCGCGTTLVVAEREKRKWIGIDISPTACRVMARRLEGNFYIKEGKDFWVKDLPKTVEELRQYPPFEFQNWAINAIGGVPSKVKVRDGGIDGKLYPIEKIQKEKTEGIDLFGDIDRYIPIQVKRTDQVGQPDIDNFETAMKRDKRNSGIFVGFDFSRDAQKEIRRAEREEGLEIQPITVAEIVERQMDKQLL